MEGLKIAQFNNHFYTLKNEASDILKQVPVSYCLPDTYQKLSGYTSLHFAAKKRALDLTSELLKQGANLFKQGTEDGCTPLHAVMNTTFARKHLYSQDKKNIDERFKKNRNKGILEYSLSKILLSKQVEINNSSNPISKYGLSHLHIACIINYSEAVEFFAKAKEPLDQPICYNFDYDPEDMYMEMKNLHGYTSLHCAVKYLSVNAANILLQYGADIHVKNPKGMSCVHLLIERIMLMTNFIRMGKRAKWVPWVENIERMESIIKLVLETRANNEIFVDDIGISAFHLAIILGDKSIIEHYLKQNVDVNMQVKKESGFWPGWTPVHFAACFRIDTMILLIQNGADITIENLIGETALDLFAQRFTPEEVQLVLSKKNEFKDIVLSDNCTKLSELLLAMNDYNKFSAFVKILKNMKLIVPLNSPIWAGYNMLHLLVSMSERTICSKDTIRFELSEATTSNVEPYNCTEDKEALYWKRIELCLVSGCSLSMKNAKEQTPINLAFSMLRETAIVKKLLSWSKDNDVDKKNLSHLHIACAVGQLDAVKRYLGKGANVNSQVNSSFYWRGTKTSTNVKANSTPLHIAVAFGHKKLISYLLKNNADIYAKNSLGLTPIHLVIMSRSADAMVLAKQIFKTATDLRDSVSKDGLTHLHAAAYANNEKIIEQLLTHQDTEVDPVVNVNVRRPLFLANLAGKTPLHVAMGNSEEATKALLKGGANVHIKDLRGLSVLQYSICDLDYSWIEPLVQMLKDKECDVGGSGITPLHFACGTHDIAWAEELLRGRADVNAKINARGNLEGATPLYIIYQPSIIYEADAETLHELYELLLHNGADVTIECYDGNTPLHLMYERNYEFSLDQDDEECINERLLQLPDLLLESQKSYDVNPVNRQGFSHFHFACVRNNVKVVEKFLDHRVDVNQMVDPFTANIGGFTPLHFAMAHGSKEVAYRLLERGADVKAEDANGNKPLHVAIKMGFVNIPLFKTMRSRGADIHATNLRKESLLYCLLKSKALTLERLDFFLVDGCFINLLKVKDRDNQGIIGLAMRNAPSAEWERMLSRLTKVEVRKAIQSGFNVIESVVAVRPTRKLTVDKYLRTIKFFMCIGCELDQEDANGKTALHKAVSFYNLEAINALLKLGADLNVGDYVNEYAHFEKIIEQANGFHESRRVNVVKALARHIWKMKLVGLYVKDSNLRCFKNADKRIFFDSTLEQSCHDELIKAEEIKINKSLTVKDFLSDFETVVSMYSDRQVVVVDNFFNRTFFLGQKFPELCGILALRYRKSSARMKLP